MTLIPSLTFTVLGDDHLILRGGLALLVGTGYLFSSRARLENLFPGKLRTEYLFSTATNLWKSKKKKRGGGGRLVRGFSRGGMTWFSMFCITFCRILARNIAIYLLECFDSDFFSVFMCIIGSKSVLFEGGLGVLPSELFLAVFIQNCAILCNNDGYMYKDIRKQQEGRNQVIINRDV